MDNDQNQEQPLDLGAILARVGNIPTQKTPEFDAPAKLKGSFQGPNLADILFSRVKSQYPDMVPDSGTFIPKGGLQKDDPNLSSFRALGSAFRYNPPPDARESSNVEDRRFTHPSLPTSDMGNYDFPTTNAFSRPKPTPPSSAAGVQGMSGTQSGPSVNRNPWTASVADNPWITEVEGPSTPPFRNGGSITDRTRQLLAKLKNRA